VLGNNGTNEIRFGNTATGGLGNIYVNNTANYTSAANGTLSMTFASNGYVGVGGLTSPTYCLELPNTASVAGEVLAYAHVTYSDERIKSDRHPLQYGLQTIMQLQPLQYFQHNSTTDSTGIHIKEDGAPSFGLLAQETYKIIPEMVNRPKDESKDLWSMDYSKLGPILIKAIQEQQQLIEAQSREIEQLKKTIKSTSTDDRIKHNESENK
jgi:hypothetical protein